MHYDDAPIIHRRSNLGEVMIIPFRLQEDQNTLTEQSVNLIIEQSLCKITLRIDLKKYNLQNFPMGA